MDWVQGLKARIIYTLNTKEGKIWPSFVLEFIHDFEMAILQLHFNYTICSK